jgi:hypothetical protein
MLAKLRAWFSKQEKICEQLAFTEVNVNFERIFDELSGAKARALTKVY